MRTGAPEVIFCPGKSPDHTAEIFQRQTLHSGRVLATRATLEQFEAVRALTPEAQYIALPRLITLGMPAPTEQSGKFVAVLCAGTSDTPVAEEAAVTLEWHGSRAVRLYDVGVAGLHRILNKLELIQSADVIIVCAGMDGALPSVVGGLVSCPVIAVPTSVGYGASFGGVAALLTMLNSCSSGVAVVNIDNGFGAAAYAHRILSRALD